MLDLLPNEVGDKSGPQRGDGAGSSVLAVGTCRHAGCYWVPCKLGCDGTARTLPYYWLGFTCVALAPELILLRLPSVRTRASGWPREALVGLQHRDRGRPSKVTAGCSRIVGGPVAVAPAGTPYGPAHRRSSKPHRPLGRIVSGPDGAVSRSLPSTRRRRGRPRAGSRLFAAARAPRAAHRLLDLRTPERAFRRTTSPPLRRRCVHMFSQAQWSLRLSRLLPPTPSLPHPPACTSTRLFTSKPISSHPRGIAVRRVLLEQSPVRCFALLFSPSFRKGGRRVPAFPVPGILTFCLQGRGEGREGAALRGMYVSTATQESPDRIPPSTGPVCWTGCLDSLTRTLHSLVNCVRREESEKKGSCPARHVCISIVFPSVRDSAPLPFPGNPLPSKSRPTPHQQIKSKIRVASSNGFPGPRLRDLE